MLKLVVCLVVLAGCDLSPPPWKELRAGETAQVYACGDWPAQQVDQIKLAVANINANVRHKNGLPFLEYMGERPALYGQPGSGAPEGGRCATLLYDGYPTEAGQARYDEAKSKDGRYGEYDGEAVYAFVDLSEPLPPFHIHDVTGLVGHELGHAIGADHIDVGDGHWALMDPPHLAYHVTPADIDEICGHEVQCDREYSSAAKARLLEAARLQPQPQLEAEGTAEIALGGCGTE